MKKKKILISRRKVGDIEENGRCKTRLFGAIYKTLMYHGEAIKTSCRVGGQTRLHPNITNPAPFRNLLFISVGVCLDYLVKEFTNLKL